MTRLRAVVTESWGSRVILPPTQADRGPSFTGEALSAMNCIRALASFSPICAFRWHLSWVLLGGLCREPRFLAATPPNTAMCPKQTLRQRTNTDIPSLGARRITKEVSESASDLQTWRGVLRLPYYLHEHPHSKLMAHHAALTCSPCKTRTRPKWHKHIAREANPGKIHRNRFQVPRFGLWDRPRSVSPAEEGQSREGCSDWDHLNLPKLAPLWPAADLGAKQPHSTQYRHT